MKKNYIHFVGIKGVGMTPLAIIAKEAGLTVTGSDIDEEFITDEALKKAKIVPFVGFSADHISQPDLVVTTGAHSGFDNIEVVTAKAAGIKVLSAGEALGEFMKGKIINKPYKGISVAGTHGKTTTAGMIATIFKETRQDPAYAIGTGNVGSLGSPGHFGRGKYFVAEADEYATEPQYDKTPRFMWQNPDLAVFTNIEFDHPDIYANLDEIRNVFLEFANKLPEKGVLVANGDDRQIQQLINAYKKQVITYGFLPGNDYVLTKVSISGDHMFFWVSAYGKSIGEFMLKVIGEHNAMNALAAIAATLESGLAMEKIRTAIQAFIGSTRRLEFIGELVTGAKMYDDYAHHPTAIQKTLQALRKQYPHKKIICLFQPHTFSRTKKLFSEFLNAFQNADTVVLTDIYSSSREKFDNTITSKVLAEGVGEKHRDVIYLAKPDDAADFVNKKRFRSDTVLVTMGAGDIYKIKNNLEFV